MLGQEDPYKKAAEIVEEKSRKSKFFFERDQGIPSFHREEIQLGKVLGKGGFCTVCEIRCVTLLNETVPMVASKDNSNNRDENDDDYDEILSSIGSPQITQDRRYMATRYLRHGKDARYAIKYLSPETKDDPQHFIAGLVDLAVEARFLSIIRHPNIIKMRATANISPFEPGYFLILDRLYDTLTERLKTWTKRKSQLNGIGKIMDMKRSKKKDFAAERMIVGLDLSSALGYLHSHNIIYRDLKPDNIGFDVRGDVKLFDFGLSIELSEDDAMNHDLYDLTGNTGSLRYMAPEVALEKPYNHKVDVYSFGILLWQMLSLKTPFENNTVTTHKSNVIVGGMRPECDGSVWSPRLTALVSQCWSEDLRLRPDFYDISSILKQEISTVRGDDSDAQLLDRSRHTEKSM